jgi:hypothetical protein
MPISENAKQIIAQTIARTAFALPVSFPEGGVTKMVDAIEQELDEAGLVVLRRDDLDAIGWNETQDRRNSDA